MSTLANNNAMIETAGDDSPRLGATPGIAILTRILLVLALVFVLVEGAPVLTKIGARTKTVAAKTKKDED